MAILAIESRCRRSYRGSHMFRGASRLPGQPFIIKQDVDPTLVSE